MLNQPAYAGASILIAGDNFGCGSIRELAPWALTEGLGDAVSIAVREATGTDHQAAAQVERTYRKRS